MTSLPSPYGIGDCGPGAYQFIDCLKSLKQKYWQILPINPIKSITKHSPYSSSSAFAGNVLLISPDLLVKKGWLKKSDLKSAQKFSDDKVNYAKVAAFKGHLFDILYDRVKESLKNDKEYQEFCTENNNWLEDFACYVAAKGQNSEKPWHQWSKRIKMRHDDALEDLREKCSDQIAQVKFLQYVFFEQWMNVKAAANAKGIRIIGDVPIYVDHDSVDVWRYPDIFKIDQEGHPIFVSGVPPDYFSETGQRWGNPVYDWDRLKAREYSWWVERIRHNVQLFDFVRIDHFRGFAGYWEIPAKDRTAVNGHWEKGPGKDLFNMLHKRLPQLPIIAEDVGHITDDVRALMKHCRFPGMKLLIFGFGDDMKNNPYLPHNYTENCVVYPGTHDNNTIKGWYQNEATNEEKKNLSDYIGKTITLNEVHWDFVTMAMNSKAECSICTLQDVLGLDSQARMNTPATLEGNWQWRFQPHAFSKMAQNRFRQLTQESHRA